MSIKDTPPKSSVSKCISFTVNNKSFISPLPYGLTQSPLIRSYPHGVLVTGTWYDFASQSYQRDVIIIKLTKQELITGTTKTKGILLSKVIVFPNPGKDRLKIRTGVKNSQFNMWDINGNLIITRRIRKISTEINVTVFKHGTYFWNLISNNKIIDSGKWIKIN